MNPKKFPMPTGMLLKTDDEEKFLPFQNPTTVSYTHLDVYKRQVVLSFLPIALGIMLLVDGIGKMPLAVDALSVYSPYRFWVLISAVLPLILGIVLLVNPFRAAKAAIMFFGISILADGLFELITYIQQRRAEKSEYKDIR